MFGKIFEQTFTGSMCGKGSTVFAVWGYIIAHTKPDHMVEVNSKLLAAAIGCPEKEVEAALKYFCSADKDSRSKEHQGRRLIKQGEYLYFVTGHPRFQGCKSHDDRKEYMRVYQRARRKRIREHKSKSV